MSSTLLRLLKSIRSRAGSRLKAIPGAKLGYQTLVEILESDHEDGEQWIKYEGYHLKIAPPDYVSRRLASSGMYEWEIRNKIKKHVSQGDVVVDVGAHIGHHTLTMCVGVGDSGRVFALEPNPENADYISETIQENNIRNCSVITKGLSDTTGQTELFVDDDNSGGASIVDNSYGSETVTIETVDYQTFMSENGIEHIDFMKIDAEGAEKEIIKDMDLNSIDNILVEVHSNIFLSNSGVRELYDTLLDNGVIRRLDGSEVETVKNIEYKEPHTVLWSRAKHSKDIP